MSFDKTSHDLARSVETKPGHNIGHKRPQNCTLTSPKGSKVALVARPCETGSCLTGLFDFWVASGILSRLFGLLGQVLVPSARLFDCCASCCLCLRRARLVMLKIPFWESRKKILAYFWQIGSRKNVH